MQIVENSPSCLRLQETSRRIAALLLAGAVILAIVVLVRHSHPKQLINALLLAVSAVFFWRNSRIEFDKSACRCGIWRQDMWRRSFRTISFGDISDVQVEIMQPDTSVQPHSRLILRTSIGPIPLTAGFRADLDKHIAFREVMVDAIFSGRARPAPLDPAQVLLSAGRPMAAYGWGKL